MASTDDSVASAEARACGNDFYKKGDLIEGKFATDPLPLSNLSAVYYEQGQYSLAIECIHKALDAAPTFGHDERKLQNLYGRLARCHLHMSNGQGALEIIQKISETELRILLLAAANDVKMLQINRVEKALHREAIMKRIPRFKPYLVKAPEYFPVGHDQADSLFDKQLRAALSPKDDVSLLFCGSGDARNVFATIFDVAFSEMRLRTKFCNFIHITIVDHKPAVMARTLLILGMIHRYITLRTSGIPEHEDALKVLSYVYTCQVIPAFALEKLHEQIELLITELEMGFFAFSCIQVAKQCAPAIIRVLKQWQKGPSNQHTVAIVRKTVTTMPKLGMLIDEEGMGSGFDRKCFKELGVLFASNKFIKRREPNLLGMVAQYKENGRKRELSEYVDAHWKLNPTMFDDDFENSHMCEEDRYAQLGFLPMEFGTKFDSISLSLLQLADRLKIECIVSEMCEMMDRLRYNALQHRNNPPASPEAHDPRGFPSFYDRIHMSNIPDYIGVHLNTFLYARPLLREDRASSLQFNNLLNPPMFRDHADFQGEYLHLYDDKNIARHFAIERHKNNQRQYDPDGDRFAALMGFKVTAFMREDYMAWRRLSKKAPLPYKHLLSKPVFEKWFYSLLLKICFPFPRPPVSDRPVHAPLNITQIFRLVDHLAEIGYPAHRLSGVLAAACSGVITTTARPPSEIIMTLEALDKAYPSKEISIQPWKAELTTLMSIWSHLLSFGIIMASGTLMPLSEISEYNVTFPDFSTINSNLPHFMLAFWNVDGGHGRGLPKDVRRFLMQQYVSPPDVRVEHESIHCVTSFKYDAHSDSATFWMRDDVVHQMKAGNWKAYIARTDNWEPITKGVEVAGGLSNLRGWLDVDMETTM
ncbi:hypothetical protein HJFPF1_09632 [Paramyrothecium foliicola]|nr:hypothetical protein HJFPF1_09632 [Paramyrothecium foliicola]